MTDLTRPTFHGFEQLPLREYAERAYLDYSMYVVLDRALPFLGAVSYTHLTLPTNREV